MPKLSEIIAAPTQAQPQRLKLSQVMAPPVRSTGQELGRQAGLTGRHLIEGASQAIGLFSDPIAGLVNTVRPGTMDSAATVGRGLADSLGLPQPEGGVERVVGGVSRGIVGAGLFAGGGGAVAGAPGLVGGTGRILAANPGSQGVAAVTGSGASELTREAGGGPLAQLGAGLAGALAPSGVTGLARLAARGGEKGRLATLANIDTFREAGAGSPTIGQATERRLFSGIESLFGRGPGSSGVIARAGEAQQAGMGARAESLADRLALRASPEQAGRAIERGISGKGGFLAQFRATSNALYAKVDQLIPPTTTIPVTRTKATLDALASPTPGAVNTSRVLSSGKVADIRNALDADLQAQIAAAGRGELPYQAVRALRSRLGEMIGDSALSPDLPTKQLKAVYASLSDDLNAAVAATGNPQAVQAASRANTFFKAGMARLEEVERVVSRNGGPERVFQAVTSGTREGATTLRAVMQSLPQEGQKALAAAVVRRMGRAKPGSQNEMGEVFSSETFLTNWNTLSREAKSALFDRFGPGYVRSLEAIAKASASIREGSKVMANPSGTAGAAGQGFALGATGFAVATGNLSAAGLILSGMAASNLSARVFTNPRVVAWLARQTTVPPAALPMQIASLKAEAQADGDDETLDLIRSLESGEQAP
jgi:hypothetical protein